MLTAERLREVLHYEPTTGIFRWIKKSAPKSHVKVGAVAGCADDLGRHHIGIDMRRYKAHRLAVLYMTGEWPSLLIDHKSTDAGDNTWRNLREATQSVNMQNQRRAKSNNATGFLGVSMAGNKFRARIKYDGRHHHLGRFETPELAYAAYVAVKREKHEGNTL